MSWVNRIAPINIGDVVQFSQAWLQCTGQFAGDVPHAKGKVINITSTKNYRICEVEWDKPNIPAKVNMNNLNKVRHLSPPAPQPSPPARP